MIETIGDLAPDPRNANQGSERGNRIIEQSVRQRGAGRSGLAASDGTMIAGSQTLQKMAELGIPIKPVHTTGDEWVVVIRDDIEPWSEEATLLAIDDNRAAELAVNDGRIKRIAWAEYREPRWKRGVVQRETGGGDYKRWMREA